MRISDVGTEGVGLVARLDATHERKGLVVIEGTLREWQDAAKGADLLRDLAAVTIGVCTSTEDSPCPLPAGLAACDIRILLGSQPRDAAEWNHVCQRSDQIEALVETLAGYIGRGRLAAVSCARTLRLTASLPPRDAVVVEALTYSMLQAGPEHAQWLELRATGGAR
jgi:hypothetical protein